MHMSSTNLDSDSKANTRQRKSSHKNSPPENKLKKKKYYRIPSLMQFAPWIHQFYPSRRSEVRALLQESLAFFRKSSSPSSLNSEMACKNNNINYFKITCAWAPESAEIEKIKNPKFSRSKLKNKTKLRK
jgi:hypothetical protein